MGLFLQHASLKGRLSTLPPHKSWKQISPARYYWIFLKF